MTNRLSTSAYSPRPKTGKRPYEPAQWALGWKESENNCFKENNSCTFLYHSVMKYHNNSAVVLQDKYTPDYDNKKIEKINTKTNEFNSKLPTYDPKNANKSHIVFGTERGEFSQKSSGITSPRMPPGGKSNIIFG